MRGAFLSNHPSQNSCYKKLHSVNVLYNADKHKVTVTRYCIDERVFPPKEVAVCNNTAAV